MGIHPLDLLFKRSFISECEATANAIAEESTIPMIVGCPVQNPVGIGKPLFNAAMVMAEGTILKIAHKRLLPTYDVFDERRYFESGKQAEHVSINGIKIGITICEDIWVDEENNNGYELDPVSELVDHKPDILINLSGSPWHVRKTGSRLRFLKTPQPNSNVRRSTATL